MDKTITILYTQNIQGKLYLLPRIATLLKQLKKKIDGRYCLLDAGNSCNDSDPLCKTTEGRASIIVLDAIGYDAVNVTGFLSPVIRQKLSQNYLQIALVDETHPFEKDGVTYSQHPPSSQTPHLHIALQTTPETYILPQSTQGFIYTLHLQTIQAGQIGLVKVRINDTNSSLMQTDIHTVTANILPDPTIAGTLDFVRDEARYYEKRQDN